MVTNLLAKARKGIVSPSKARSTVVLLAAFLTPVASFLLWRDGVAGATWSPARTFLELLYILSQEGMYVLLATIIALSFLRIIGSPFVKKFKGEWAVADTSEWTVKTIFYVVMSYNIVSVLVRDWVIYGGGFMTAASRGLDVAVIAFAWLVCLAYILISWKDHLF